MKWLEVIKLRIAEKDQEPAEKIIMKLIKDVSNNSSMRDIKFYRNASVGNDLSINLHWKSGKVDPQGSATGLCLVHLFKDFGLVSHSVWVEE